MWLHLLKPILEVLHLIRSVVSLIYTASLYIGGCIIVAAISIWETVKDVSLALDVIGEEFNVFIHDLRDKLDIFCNCISTVTLSSLIGVLDTLQLSFEYLRKFHVDSDLLFVTRIGRFFNEYGLLFKDALLLIFDCICWILELGPKTVFFCIDGIISLIAMSIEFLHIMISKSISLLYGMTVTLPVAYVFWRNRYRIAFYIIRCFQLIFRYSLSPLKQVFKYKRPDTLSVCRKRYIEEIPVSGLCIVCMENQKCILLLPCKHLCFCNPCAIVYTSHPHDTCPLCRSEITCTMLVYI